MEQNTINAIDAEPSAWGEAERNATLQAEMATRLQAGAKVQNLTHKRCWRLALSPRSARPAPCSAAAPPRMLSTPSTAACGGARRVAGRTELEDRDRTGTPVIEGWLSSSGKERWCKVTNRWSTDRPLPLLQAVASLDTQLRVRQCALAWFRCPAWLVSAAPRRIMHSAYLLRMVQ